MKSTLVGMVHEVSDIPDVKKLLHDLLSEKLRKSGWDVSDLPDTEQELFGILGCDEDVKKAIDLEEANEEVTPV